MKSKSPLHKERAAARRRRKFYRLKNHPFVVPVLTLFVFFFLAMVGFIALNGRTVTASDSHIVKLSIDGKQKVIPTRAKTVGDLLTRANITLNEGDIIEPEKDTEILDDNFRVNLYRAHPVTLYDGEKRIQSLSAATTPRSVAAQIGLAVYPEDKITVEGSGSILQEGVLGQKIVVERAKLAYINLYGTPISLRTHSKTVGELIQEKGIKLAADDTLQPDKATVLTPVTQVFVIRNGTQIASAEETVAMPVETIDDPKLSFGTIVIRQRGSAGKKIVTYQLELKNNKEVSRKKIQEVISVEPVKQIVARGQAVYIPADKSVWMRQAGISESDFAYVYFIISRENASWCPTRWQGQVGCPPFYQEKYPGAESDTRLGYGIGQATPAKKMAAFGSDWRTNGVTQLKWADSYAKSRTFTGYGSGWKAAYEHKRDKGWW